MKKYELVDLVIIGVIGFMLGNFLSDIIYSSAKREAIQKIKIEAIEHGVAKYQLVDKKSKEVKFVWIEKKEKK